MRKPKVVDSTIKKPRTSLLEQDDATTVQQCDAINQGCITLGNPGHRLCECFHCTPEVFGRQRIGTGGVTKYSNLQQ